MYSTCRVGPSNTPQESPSPGTHYQLPDKQLKAPMYVGIPYISRCLAASQDSHIWGRIWTSQTCGSPEFLYTQHTYFKTHRHLNPSNLFGQEDRSGEIWTDGHMNTRLSQEMWMVGKVSGIPEWHSSLSSCLLPGKDRCSTPLGGQTLLGQNWAVFTQRRESLPSPKGLPEITQT